MENNKMKGKIIGARHIEDEMNDLAKVKLPICLDFDGTCVFHRYPNVGPDIPHCVETLKKWVDGGVGIILDTMRSGSELEEAIGWFKKRGIPLYGIGKEPHQHEWTESPKAYGVFSVDDRNLGTPLRHVEGERPMVDWYKVDAFYTPIILGLAKVYK